MARERQCAGTFLSIFLVGAIVLLVALVWEHGVPGDPRKIGVPFVKELALALLIAAIIGYAIDRRMNRRFLDELSTSVELLTKMSEGLSRVCASLDAVSSKLTSAAGTLSGSATDVSRASEQLVRREPAPLV